MFQTIIFKESALLNNEYIVGCTVDNICVLYQINTDFIDRISWYWHHVYSHYRLDRSYVSSTTLAEKKSPSGTGFHGLSQNKYAGVLAKISSIDKLLRHLYTDSEDGQPFWVLMVSVTFSLCFVDKYQPGSANRFPDWKTLAQYRNR